MKAPTLAILKPKSSVENQFNLKGMKYVKHPD